MDRLDQLFQQFLRERTYILNVTPATCEWYQCAWKAYQGCRSHAADRAPSAGLISKTDLQHFVVHVRQRGVRPVTCNTWIRAMNALSLSNRRQVGIGNPNASCKAGTRRIVCWFQGRRRPVVERRGLSLVADPRARRADSRDRLPWTQGLPKTVQK